MTTTHQRIESLLQRLCDAPQYATQGAVWFIDLATRQSRRAWLPLEVVNTFLGGRGANMYLLYNTMDENLDPLDPGNPLIFGTGVLTGYTSAAARANVSGLSPDSDALVDSNCGDYFPAYMRLNGIDHIVLYGQTPGLTLLELDGDKTLFHDAEAWRGMDNTEFRAAVEQHFDCRERRNMAMARITSAGENRVLCSGIMGGPKAIWARGGAGAKMGRSAGTAIQLVAKEGDFATLRLPSTEMRRVPIDCRATIGEVGNAQHELVKIGKAGRNRWKGVKPQSRGVVMNPVDHPHGGGEGKTSGGRHPVSPWGKPEGRTRRANQESDKLIVRRRRTRGSRR